MAMEAKLNGFSADPNRQIIPTEIETKDTTAGMVSSTNTVKKTTFGDDGDKGKIKDNQKDKEVAQSTLESAMSNMNSRIKKTRCEYDFDDPTNTITVKVYDKDTGDLIREVPPEKSLEAIKKIWEIAGLIVDEKR